MAECNNCKRKFKTRGTAITEETPDYVVLSHPRRGGSIDFIFCGRSCMFKFFARDLARAIVSLAKI